MLSLSLIILSHNRLLEISKNLPLLISSLDEPDEIQIIIVDNNSTDGSQLYLIDLQKKYPKIKLVLNNRNLGVGGGRNSGFAFATREYIVALDDDTSITIEDLRRIPKLFEKYSRAGLLAFRVVNPISNEIQNSHGESPCEIANHHGAGFAFRKIVYDHIGGIDEECDFGAEELDFSIRVRANGWVVLYVPELTVFHNNLPRKIIVDKFRRMRRVYNNVRIYFKYFPKWMAFRNGSRYLLLASRTWIMNYGLSGINDLVIAAFQGYDAGKLKYKTIPKDVVHFYNNIRLLPEFGNVPLFYKFAKSLPCLVFPKRRNDAHK
jgi:GT2 family glycosyltransferase